MIWPFSPCDMLYPFLEEKWVLRGYSEGIRGRGRGRIRRGRGRIRRGVCRGVKNRSLPGAVELALKLADRIEVVSGL